jgi:RHS repeat-associated protein
VSGAKYATTTEYVFNGDTLVSTIDQQLASGVATGSAKTLYIHPDHLGSTNVVTDASGTVVQTLDYYPYGATRINSTSGNYSGAGRQYVNRFADQSSLDYLQARYYEASRGQFLSQDPVFLGNPLDQDLRNPQSLNSYSYANYNQITSKDPDGKQAAVLASAAYAVVVAALQAIALALSAILGAYTGSNIHVNVPTGGTTQQLVQPLPAQTQNPFAGGSFGIPQSQKPSATTVPLDPTQANPFPGLAPYSFSDPKSPKKFVQPTNPAQLPPRTIPEGNEIRVGPKTADYPDGY